MLGAQRAKNMLLSVHETLRGKRCTLQNVNIVSEASKYDMK